MDSKIISDANFNTGIGGSQMREGVFADFLDQHCDDVRKKTEETLRLRKKNEYFF